MSIASGAEEIVWHNDDEEEEHKNYDCNGKESESDAGIFKPQRFPAGFKTLECISCGSQLALQDAVVSHKFTGRRGAALLVAAPVANVLLGSAEDRLLATGLYRVADLRCANPECSAYLGWKYLETPVGDAVNAYKRDKYILERATVLGFVLATEHS